MSYHIHYAICDLTLPGHAPAPHTRLASLEKGQGIDFMAVLNVTVLLMLLPFNLQSDNIMHGLIFLQPKQPSCSRYCPCYYFENHLNQKKKKKKYSQFLPNT